MSVLAVIALAGCSGTPTNTVATDAPVTPIPMTTYDSAPPPGPPPPTPIAVPTPTPTPTVDCAKLPTTTRGAYWQVQATAPATCRQATDLLSKALVHPTQDRDFTVDGWRCHPDNLSLSLPNDRLTCTKGQLSVDAVLHFDV
jgi:hypothetical protein